MRCNAPKEGIQNGGYLSSPSRSSTALIIKMLLKR